MVQTLFSFLQKQATLIRRSNVLSFSPTVSVPCSNALAMQAVLVLASLPATATVAVFALVPWALQLWYSNLGQRKL